MSIAGIILGGIILSTYVFVVIYAVCEVCRIRKLLEKEKKSLKRSPWK